VEYVSRSVRVDVKFLPEKIKQGFKLLNIQTLVAISVAILQLKSHMQTALKVEVSSNRFIPDNLNLMETLRSLRNESF
jgi:hypothetical protein